jgi:hypothetical protein
MAIQLFCFHTIARHYKDVSTELTIDPSKIPPAQKTKVIVLVYGVHVGTLKALAYARSISNDVNAVYVEIEPAWTDRLENDWVRYVPDIPLTLVKSPYRSLVQPIMRFLDELHTLEPDKNINVVVGEFVSTKWWHKLLHGNTGIILKLAFLSRRDVIVTNVRYWLSK